MISLPAKTAHPSRLQRLGQAAWKLKWQLYSPKTHTQSDDRQPSKFRKTPPPAHINVVSRRVLETKSLYSNSPGQSPAWATARYTPCWMWMLIFSVCFRFPADEKFSQFRASLLPWRIVPKRPIQQAETKISMTNVCHFFKLFPFRYIQSLYIFILFIRA